MASLFERIRDLLTTNLDELLNRDGDKQTVGGRRVRQLERNLACARAAMLEALTREQQLHRELENRRRQRDQAVQARGQETQANLDALERAHDQARRTTEQCRARLHGLEDALQHTQVDRTASSSKPPASDISEFLGRLGIRLAALGTRPRRGKRPENDELARTFEDIERQAGLEHDLASLRRKLNKD